MITTGRRTLRHVKAEMLAEELQAATEAGFTVADRPMVRRSQEALLQKV